MSRFTLFGTFAFQNLPHCLHPLRAAVALLPISAVIFPFAFKYGPRRRACSEATPRSPLRLSISPPGRRVRSLSSHHDDICRLARVEGPVAFS